MSKMDRDRTELLNMPPSIDHGKAEADTASNSGEIDWFKDSEAHNEIKALMIARADTGEIFGSNWKEHLGFFMPFGTKNSFWARLTKSATFQHLFAYDHEFVETLKRFRSFSLTVEIPSPRITVHDVDATVNNCALICALLLGVPMSIVSNFAGGNSDGWIDWMRAMHDTSHRAATWNYICDATDANYSEVCLKIFERTFMNFFGWVTVSFYAALFTLITAVVYYMCRPSESCNNTSLNTLLDACTLEVRKKIRETRCKAGEEHQVIIDPKIPFDSWGEETEVFLKAKFMAKAESEEQCNQEFYMWYKSKTTSIRLKCFCF
jgi:hypothetical protein